MFFIRMLEKSSTDEGLDKQKKITPLIRRRFLDAF